MENTAWELCLADKEEMLLNGLEAEIDEEKIRYYILLDELF